MKGASQCIDCVLELTDSGLYLLNCLALQMNNDFARIILAKMFKQRQNKLHGSSVGIFCLQSFV